MPKNKLNEQELKEILLKQINQVNKWYLRFKNNPYVPKNIHQLRVQIRKLRSHLNFIKPLIEDETYNALNGILKNFAQDLSPTREIDVLIKECNRIAKKEPTLIDNYSDVFRFLEKIRLKLIKDISTKKAYMHFNESIKKIEENIKLLNINMEANSIESLDVFMEQRFAHKKNKFKESYHNIDMADYENIHDIRKQAKKIRYIVDAFKEWLPSKDRKEVSKKAEKVQDKLGKHTDAYINLEMFKEYKKKTDNEDLKNSFSQLIKYYNEKE